MIIRLLKNRFRYALIILFLHIIFTNIIMLQAQNTRLPVGAIPGVIDVSPMGAATYTIPIEVVPGTMGMQPNLSIVYNSMGGMGLLGMKWSLSGLSAITRCGQIPYYDNGNITAIQFNGNDRFALDGDRLIQLSSGTYGAIDAEYATEVENFTRIFSYGGTTGHPTAFRAYTDDGSIIEYGVTSDSRQRVKAGTLLSWYINKITDANGNYMTFHYDSLGSEIWIDSIRYTRTGGGIQPYAKVVFDYTALPDTLGRNTYFAGGYGIPQTKLLETITVFYKDTVVRKYQFNYNVNDTDERTTHLKEVVLSDGNRTELNATTIKWGKQSTSIKVDTITGLLNGKILTGDFNGDGYTDLLVYDIDQVGKGWKLYLYIPSTNTYHPQTSNETITYDKLYVHDIDGNGRDELIVRRKIWDMHQEEPYHEFEIYSIHLGYPVQIGQKITPVHRLSSVDFGDFDGNGSTNIMFTTKENTNPKSCKLTFKKVEGNQINDMCNPMTITTESVNIGILDINGNGKKNIHVKKADGNNVFYEFNGSSFAAIPHGDLTTSASTLFNYGDINGDGITDISIVYDENNKWKWKFFIGKGNGTFIEKDLTTMLDLYDPKTGLFIDLNGDGKDDLIMVRGYDGVDGITTFDILLSKGCITGNFKYSSKRIKVPGRYIDSENWFVGDFDGDGKLDILFKNALHDQPKILYFNKNEEYEFVKEIEDGMKKRILLDYEHKYFIAQSWHSLGNFTLIGSLKKYFLSIVQSIQVSNGIGNGLNALQYQYTSPSFSLQRRTFLGFEEFACIDNQENKRNSLFFEFDARFSSSQKQILRPTKQTSYHNSQLANETLYTYKLKDLDNNTRFIPYYDKVAAKDILSDSKTETTATLNTAGRDSITNTKMYNSCNASVDNWLYSETKTYSYETITLNDNQKKTVPKSVLIRQQYPNNATQIIDTLTYAYYDVGDDSKRRLKSVRKGNFHGSITTCYDSYSSVGVCYKKTILAGSDSRTEKYDYDNDHDPTRRFPMIITNPAGHITSFTYDLKTGNKLSETDPNNLTTTYNYDAFGNLKQINYSDGTQTNISTDWFSASHLPNARYTVTTTSTGKPMLKVYYDILGREVCRLEDNNYFETRYNAKGQVEKTSYPFGAFNVPDTVWHYYTYDGYGRKATEKAPYINLSYAYHNRKITVTDSLRNISSSKTYDALGRIVNATDSGGVITYTYWAFSAGGNSGIRHRTIIEVTDNNNDAAITTILSDLWGNRRSIEEPNAGTITSEYNGFNELKEQKDARNNITKYEYDRLGRVTKKQYTTSGITHRTVTYEYDNFTSINKGRGKLHQIKIDGTRSETFTYDTLSRLAEHMKRIDNTDFTHRYTYTANGQLHMLTYPAPTSTAPFRVTYKYTSTGKLDEIRRSNDNSLIYKVNSRNNKYHLPTRCEFGNGVATDYTYNPHGLVIRIQTGNKITVFGGPGSELSGFDTSPVAYTIDSAILNYRYAYNDLGLMVSRSESVINYLEKYTYDNLDRLTGIISGTIGKSGTFETQIFDYQDNGDIAFNSNVGDYTYGGSRPHAVTQVEPIKNVFLPIECAVTYNYFNQPTEIIEGRYRLVLSYDANQQRQKAERYYASGLSNTRYYINKYYEKEILPIGGERHYHYIYGDNGIVALHINYATAGTDSMHYIHTDHLGSYCAITNAVKRTVQYNYFDPWGNYRPMSGEVHPQDTGYYDDPQRAELVITSNFPRTLRGFTGHEHYPFFKIINMKGRLYDPVIGRFFSPDKYVANSSFTQDFNRYTYARNNPLMYVDPDGNFIWFFPTFSLSKESGLNVGFTFGVGIPGIASASANIGYSIKNNDFSASIGVTAAMNTIYGSYSTQSGFSVGWVAGMTQFAGFPFSTNVATVGANYNFTNKTLSANMSAFQWQQDQGWSFNPSFSAAILPQQFSNLVRGQGFRSNSQVFDRMMRGDYTCQQILNYFGFRGTYNPDHAYFKKEYSPGATNPKTGDIFYSDGAFSNNYDYLALVAHHESIHSRTVRAGRFDGNYALDDWNTYMENYKNQGLYPNYGNDLVTRINTSGTQAGIYGPNVGGSIIPPFSPAWWHFIYRIPRLW